MQAAAPRPSLRMETATVDIDPLLIGFCVEVDSRLALDPRSGREPTVEIESRERPAFRRDQYDPHMNGIVEADAGLEQHS